MGLNISGIAINKNLESDINELERILNKKLTPSREVVYETALDNSMDANSVFVLFKNNGTLVLHNLDFVYLNPVSKGYEILDFGFVDTMALTKLNLFKDGNMIRGLVSQEGMEMMNQGEKLEEEKNTNSTEELIETLVNKYIGDSVRRMDLGEKFKVFSPERLEQKPKEEKKVNKKEWSPEDKAKWDEFANSITEKYAKMNPKPQKKWWEIWK